MHNDGVDENVDKMKKSSKKKDLKDGDSEYSSSEEGDSKNNFQELRKKKIHEFELEEDDNSQKKDLSS